MLQGHRVQMTVRRLRFFAAAAVLCPAALNGQAVRGAVIDRGTNASLPGVVVMLLDSAGTAVARGLTNERGEYRLSASSAGTYRVRTLRIGFRPATSAPVALSPGDDATQDLLVAAVPFTLDTVRVVGRNACRAIGDSSTFAIWEQVRTALTAAQLTARVRNLEATLVSYERTLEMDLRTIREQSSGIKSGFVTQPWSSLPPESLRRRGYVVIGADNFTTYHAPGLEVLLSDVFLEDHCFRLERSRDATRLGIGFEPTRERRNVAEIRGTLWLDRKSSELRSMDYRYVNVSSDQEAWARGDLEFVRMHNGGWAISRWSIRMPVVVLRERYGGGLEPRVSEMRVAGGELALVVRAGDTLWARPPIVLAGIVTDSLSGTPVSGAHVALRGTSLAGTTNDAGRFMVAGVLPGEYTLEVRTPSLESVNAVHQAPLAFTDDATPIQIRVPNAQQFAAAVCGNARALTNKVSEGILVGTVQRRGDSFLPPRMTVVVEWNDFTIQNDVLAQRPRWLDGQTDAKGVYRICGVPINTAMVVRALSDSSRAASVTTRIPPNGRFARADLILDEQLARAAAMTGVVLADSSRQPVADAEVILPELSKSVFTNERGRFRLSDIPPGEHQLVVRRLGYAAFTVRVAFAANQTVQREIVLTKAVVLDTVAVAARGLIPSFEEHRKIGLGKFLTREDLAKQSGRKMSEVLAQFSGVRVIQGTGGKAFISAGRKSVPRYRPIDPPRDMRLVVEQGYCYAQVYMNGSIIYAGDPEELPFDMNGINPDQIEAVEYYASPAETPLRYSRKNSDCGVVVIHTLRGR